MHMLFYMEADFRREIEEERKRGMRKDRENTLTSTHTSGDRRQVLCHTRITPEHDKRP